VLSLVAQALALVVSNLHPTPYGGQITHEGGHIAQQIVAREANAGARRIAGVR
jgi:hypothetical protein